MNPKRGSQYAAAVSSGIVDDMLNPVGEAGTVEVHDLIEDTIIPTDWQERFIVKLAVQGQRGCFE